ncbi:MAG: hypothetical protein IPJ58_09240 [Ardenticatenia bacterium]|nr:hypothetical protein [Ardenticatenia bacterium]
MSASKSSRHPRQRRTLVVLMCCSALAIAIIRPPAQARPADSLDWPEDIAVEPQGGDVWLLMKTDTAQACVQRYSADLRFEASWAADSSAATIAVGRGGQVGVGDYDGVTGSGHVTRTMRPRLTTHHALGAAIDHMTFDDASVAHLDLAVTDDDAWLALTATTVDASKPILGQLLTLGIDGRVRRQPAPVDASAVAADGKGNRYVISRLADSTVLWRMIDGRDAQQLRILSGAATGLAVLPDGRPVVARYATGPTPPGGVACELALIDLVGGADQRIPLAGLRSREVAAGPDGSLFVLARRDGAASDQNWELHRYSSAGEHLGQVNQSAMQHPCSFVPTSTAGPSPTAVATRGPEPTVTATGAASATATVEPTLSLTPSPTSPPPTQASITPLPTATAPIPTTTAPRIYLPWVHRN